MPITAAVIGALRVQAVLAAYDIAAESHRAAALDRRHQLAETDVAGIGFTPSRSMVAEDIHVIHLPRGFKTPLSVKDRIKSLKDAAFPSKIQFSACGYTKEGMEKKEGHPIAVLFEAVIVPSGVVRLMELQEKGWSYVRP
jgi:intracellular sulfur oxidation DsrE/DsrF family protein